MKKVVFVLSAVLLFGIIPAQAQEKIDQGNSTTAAPNGIVRVSSPAPQEVANLFLQALDRECMKPQDKTPSQEMMEYCQRYFTIPGEPEMLQNTKSKK